MFFSMTVYFLGFLGILQTHQTQLLVGVVVYLKAISVNDQEAYPNVLLLKGVERVPIIITLP
jgi:hypothetical protein